MSQLTTGKNVQGHGFHQETVSGESGVIHENHQPHEQHPGTGGRQPVGLAGIGLLQIPGMSRLRGTPGAELLRTLLERPVHEQEPEMGRPEGVGEVDDGYQQPGEDLGLDEPGSVCLLYTSDAADE